MIVRQIALFSASILLALSMVQAQELVSPATESIHQPTTGDRSSPSMEDYEQLEALALRGDYQSQRNLSYWLSGGLGIPPNNPILGCAWRIVILGSGSPAVDESDVANKMFYCDSKLTKEGVTAAEAQAKKLAAKISEH